MKTIDIRLKDDEVEMLRSMIGKELSFIEHDEYQFTPTSSQVLGMVVDNEKYYLYSFNECLDYLARRKMLRSGVCLTQNCRLSTESHS